MNNQRYTRTIESCAWGPRPPITQTLMTSILAILRMRSYLESYSRIRQRPMLSKSRNTTPKFNIGLKVVKRVPVARPIVMKSPYWVFTLLAYCLFSSSKGSPT